MNESRFTAQANPDEVEILYDGRQVLYWDRGEWEEDPDVVVAIVKAVKQAYEQPHVLYRWLEETGRLPNADD